MLKARKHNNAASNRNHKNAASNRNHKNASKTKRVIVRAKRLQL